MDNVTDKQAEVETDSDATLINYLFYATLAVLVIGTVLKFSFRIYKIAKKQREIREALEAHLEQLKQHNSPQV